MNLFKSDRSKIILTDPSFFPLAKIGEITYSLAPEARSMIPSSTIMVISSLMRVYV